ncbi:hypothetical protein [Jiangella muralis]|uniref:hypothetical protein n=1 Tax=Jiangella muralis TaxID=702383 RepID=UPI00069EC2B5|nr:hypothetical protein [Jiangella muralis]
MPLHAFVDESFSGDYVVVAALVPAGKVNAARAALRAVLRPGQRRIHFKDERPPRKDRVLSVIDHLEVTATVYVTTNERKARGVCLERMVPDLAAAGVSRLVLERDESLARFDRQVLARLAREYCPDLVYEHQRAHSDLLLCVPDAIAWCWAKGGHWRDRVAGCTTEIRV